MKRPRIPEGARRFLFENSIFLIAGAAGALVWANVNADGYHRFVGMLMYPPDGAHGPAPAAGHGYELFALRFHEPFTLKLVVDDILMAFFFAIAGKEVWEALLPGGPLSNVRTAALPLLATLGGMAGPAFLYIGGCFATGTWDDLGQGWAVPCATDIAFSYLVARFIFGPRHTAIPFLLLLAIADDAGGLIILAVAYPQHGLQPEWLALTAAAIGLGFGLRRLRLHSFWWYLVLPGTLSWFSFYQVGIHPALGLIPIIPTMPHAHTDLGIFARRELGRHDTLNAFEHWWKNPVELILGLFGLVNAGVPFGSVGTGTALVFVGLLIGKPLGIALFAILGEKAFRLELPRGMSHKHLVTLGAIAGIGFTVALFVASAAFKEPGAIQDSVKMGALASFFAAPLAIIVAKVLGVRRLSAGEEDEPPPDASADED